MLNDAVIVGIGETSPMGKAARDIRALVIDACLLALDDAGLSPDAIDGIVSDMLIMPTTVPQDYVAAQLGIERRFGAAISWGGAGVTCAPWLARDALKNGRANTVLCYFGVDWGSRAGGPYAFSNLFPAKSVFEKPYGFNAQPAYFALWARRYMHEFGLTQDDLATIAIRQRINAQRNGRSQQMKPLSLADYHDSRMVADPLRVADCCLISDGACAVVVTTSERARDLKGKSVHILGGALCAEAVSGDDVFTQPASLLRMPGAEKAAKGALAEAGLALSDIDFLEVYDCFTISCLIQMEDLGFCTKGEAANFLRQTDTTVDGSFPINTHGGLLAHSYLLGAEHVVEAVRQLRGDAGNAQVRQARIGMVGGLSLPEYGVLLLGA